MENFKNHWNNIYANKTSLEVSWTQQIPTTSLAFLRTFNLTKDASIIDVGAGESKFVDFLLDQGFSNITVLDISEEAINKSKARLGERAAYVNWIVSDVTAYVPSEKFAEWQWHDRATFHFLTQKEQIEKYVQLAATSLANNGYLAIGTFSESGPKKCSGLEIKQYSEGDLESTLRYHFKKIKCIHEDHVTPFDTRQNFLFCSFQKAA